MRIQVLSDLHIEDQDFTIPETDADVIVLAGDIHEGTRAIPWIKAQTDKPVIYVAGNHEYYGELCPERKYKLERACHSNFNYTRTIKDEATGKELITGEQQINFLEKSEVILTDGYKVTGKFMVPGHEFDDFETTSVRFLGCTLWTESSPWIRYRRIKSLKSYKQLESSGYENFRLQLSEFSPSDAKQIF
ncbi:MAG: metallophosphoesterase, partial [Lentisphaerales bacterium]|nr:metallophosphoesterase [Lentisphaerales bacterium]